MSEKAKAAMGVDALEMLADRGYFSGGEIVACEAILRTSGAKQRRRYGESQPRKND